MKLEAEERYIIREINVNRKIKKTLQILDLNRYSVEFFISDDYLVIRIYKRF